MRFTFSPKRTALFAASMAFGALGAWGVVQHAGQPSGWVTVVLGVSFALLVAARGRSGPPRR